MSNKYKPNTRLGRYLRSRGTWIPDNINKYKEPSGDMHLCCVLCDEPHDRLPFYQNSFANIRVSSVIAAVHLCIYCHGTTQDLEGLMKPSSNPLQGGAVMDDMAMNAKMDLLIFDKKFTEDAYHFLEHIEGRYEYLKGEDYDGKMLCYFCEKEINAGTTIMPEFVYMPCGNDIYTVDGGTLTVCPSCVEELENRLPEQSIRFFLSENFPLETCDSCRQPYFITQEEERLRVNSNTMGMYQCGACAYGNVHTSTMNKLYMVKKNTAGRLARYVDQVCELCSQAFSIDQMLLPNYLLRNHVNSEGKVICENCRCGTLLAFEAIVKRNVVYNVAFLARRNYFIISVRSIYGQVYESLVVPNAEVLEQILEKIQEADDTERPKSLR